MEGKVDPVQTSNRNEGPRAYDTASLASRRDPGGWRVGPWAGDSAPKNV